MASAIERVELLHQRDQGIDAPPGRMTVAQFLEHWLTAYAEPNVAPSTLLRYKQLIQKQLVPHLGHLALAKLRPIMVQSCYSTLFAKGLSGRTVLHSHRVLREALQHALKWQLIVNNPADLVEAPRAQRYQVPAMAPEQAEALIEAAAHTPYGTVVELAIMAGLRMGELLGLRWQDVDLEAGVLSVRQTCQWLPQRGFIFRQPKTHRSERPVALTAGTVEALRQHRRKQLEGRLLAGPAYVDNDLVFATPLGEPIDPANLRRTFRGITKAVGQPKLRFHDLRHGHATLMLKGGAHPKIVQERLGHASITTTLDVYSHVLPNLQAEAIASLDGLIGRHYSRTHENKRALDAHKRFSPGDRV